MLPRDLPSLSLILFSPLDALFALPSPGLAALPVSGAVGWLAVGSVARVLTAHLQMGCRTVLVGSLSSSSLLTQLLLWLAPFSAPLQRSRHALRPRLAPVPLPDLCLQALLVSDPALWRLPESELFQACNPVPLSNPLSSLPLFNLLPLSSLLSRLVSPFLFLYSPLLFSLLSPLLISLLSLLSSLVLFSSSLPLISPLLC